MAHSADYEIKLVQHQKAITDRNLSINSNKFISYCRFNKAVYTLLVKNSINGRTFIKFPYKSDLRASLANRFRCTHFFFAKRKIIINRTMKTSYQFGCVSAFIGNQGADTLHFSTKYAVSFGKFYTTYS